MGFNEMMWRSQGRPRTADGWRCHTAMDPQTGATVLEVEQIVQAGHGDLGGRDVHSLTDEQLTNQLRRLAGLHPDYGYRSLYCILRMEGFKVSMGRVRRVYRAAGLALPPATDTNRIPRAPSRGRREGK